MVTPVRVLALVVPAVIAHGAADAGVVSGFYAGRHLAGVKGADVDYTVGRSVYQGYLSFPEKPISTPAPGVLIAHQWMGLTDYEKHRADQIAANGYVAFAIDVYCLLYTSPSPRD